MKARICCWIYYLESFGIRSLGVGYLFLKYFQFGFCYFLMAVIIDPYMKFKSTDNL